MKMLFLCTFMFSLLCKVVTSFTVETTTTTAPSIVCGLPPLIKNTFSTESSHLVRGYEALPGSWPWLVSLQCPLDYEGRYFIHMCGGIIVNQWWVLTAAHCFEGVGSEYLQWRLVMGAHQLSNLGPETQIRKISRKIVHEEYNPKTEKNDITLLLMDNALSFSSYIQPACLPRTNTILENLTECFIADWGVTSEEWSKPADILQEAQVILIPLKKCNSTNWYNGAVGKYNLCAAHERAGIASCQGDSGGPLMCKRPHMNTFTVIGITSWGSGCAQARSPGVYTSGQYFLDWIVAVIGKNRELIWHN